MWRIAGGIELFNLLRKITRAISGLIGSVMDFDTQMRNVTSITGNAGKDFKALSDDVLNLALDPKIKDGPAKLAEGLYEIMSAGFKAADALVVLKAAAYAGTAGVTTTAVASDALTTVLNAYNLDASHATEVSNTLFEAVFVGKMTFEQLAGSIGNVIPTAASLGLKLVDITGAMAALTLKGLDADTAATYLNGILVGFLKPTDALTEAVQAHGYATAQDALQTLGFADTMTLLNQIIQEGSGNTADYISDSRAMRGVMSLLGGDMSLFQDSIDKVGGAQKGLGATQEALNEQMKAASFQFAVLKKDIQVLAIMGFGLLLPYLTKALGWFNKFFGGLLAHFRHFREKGYGFIHALRAAIKDEIRDIFGTETLHVVLKWVDKIIGWFYKFREVVENVWAKVKRIFHFIVQHFDIIGPAILGAVLAIKLFTAAVAIMNAVLAITEILASPLLLFFVVLAAAGALFALAWAKDWHHTRQHTKDAIDFIETNFKRFWKFIEPARKVIGDFAHYIHRVFHGADPKDLDKFPKALQPLIYIFGRLTKTVRIFIKTWKDHGFKAALDTIPTQLRALGRALGGLFSSFGFKHTAKIINDTFHVIAKTFRDVVRLIDDVIHGRWNRMWHDLRNIAMDLIYLFIMRLELIGALVLDIFNAIPWGTVAHGLRVAGIFVIKQFWNGIKFIGSWLWDRISGYFKDKMDKEMADAKDWYDVGRTIVSWLWTGIASLAGWLGDQIWGAMNSIASSISGFFNTFYDIGKYLVTGLYDGIITVWNWMVSELSKAWNALPDVIKKLWEHASPSKVFYRIGVQAMKGLELGFTKGGKLAANELRNVADGMSSGVTIDLNGRRRMAPIVSNPENGKRNGKILQFGPGAIVVKAEKLSRAEANKLAKWILDEADRVEAAG